MFIKSCGDGAIINIDNAVAITRVSNLISVKYGNNNEIDIARFSDCNDAEKCIKILFERMSSNSFIDLKEIKNEIEAEKYKPTHQMIDDDFDIER